MAALLLVASSLVAVAVPAGANVIPGDTFFPTYQLDMTAKVHGNHTLTFTVNFEQAEPDHWGIGSWRFGNNDSDIEVAGGPGAGLYHNCSDFEDEPGCPSNEIEWGEWSGSGPWTGTITGDFDCTSSYSLYFTSIVNYEYYFPRDDYANDYVQGDGYGYASANVVVPRDAVQCPASPIPVVGSNVRQVEGNSGTTPIAVTVGLDATPIAPVNVTWSTEDGTARAGTDYLPASGALTFAAGQTSKTVTVNALGDRLIEPDETFTVNAISPFGTASSDVTIANDEPGVAMSSPSTIEGTGNSHPVSVQVTLSNALPVSTALTYSASDSTGTVTIPAGQTTASFSVTVNGDVIRESGETIAVDLANSDGQSLAVSTITVIDDDPTISLTSPTLAEGNSGGSLMTFTLSVSTTYPIPVTFGYSTGGGTATAGQDYTTTSGTFTVSAGASSQTFTVPITGDLIDEPDQTINVAVTYPGGVAAASTFGTIADDDASPVLTASSPSVSEGNTTSPNSLPFAVTMSGRSEFVVSVNVQAVGVTAASSDFYATSGVYSIQPGATSVGVSVRVRSDKTYEGNETLRLVLSSPTNATLSPTQGTATIIDDDLAPTIKVQSAAIAEGDNGTRALTYVVSLSAVSGLPATFAYTSGDSTAKSAQGDYQPVLGNATIPAGDKSVSITVPVTGDSLFENNETFKLLVRSPTGARITSASGTVSGTGTITNDDAPPSISIDDISAAEGTGGAPKFTFVVTLSRPSGLAASVKYATVGGPAQAGSDYTSKAGSVSIPAGATTRTVVVAITGDAVREPDEQFVVKLTTPVKATLARTQATGSIVNDD